MAEKVYIVMPAYNEAVNIKKTIEQWYPLIEKLGDDSRLVIVNDGSKDDTYEVMNSVRSIYPKFIPITKTNTGHGATCLFAYNYSIENQVDYIFQTDSDGQTNPDEFWEFWNNRHEFDFIIGARTNRQDGLSRKIVTKVLQLVVHFIFGVSVKDANTPFRLMNRTSLEKILKVIPKDFFLSNVAISTIAIKWKMKCKWIPISFKPRQGGVNSINLKRIIKIGWKAIGDLRKVNKAVKAN